MRQFLVVLLSKFGMLKRHLFYTWVDCLNCWVIKIVEPKKLGPVKRAGGRDPKKGFFIAVGENAMCGTEIDPPKKMWRMRLGKIWSEIIRKHEDHLKPTQG